MESLFQSSWEGIKWFCTKQKKRVEDFVSVSHALKRIVQKKIFCVGVSLSIVNITLSSWKVRNYAKPHYVKPHYILYSVIVS